MSRRDRQRRKDIAGNKLAFEVLSDVGNKVAERFGIVFAVPDDVHNRYERFGIDLDTWNADGKRTLPLPATYVLDTDGTIVHAFVEEDYTLRAEPAEVLAAVRKLASK
jgi:peroxiredoxin